MRGRDIDEYLFYVVRAKRNRIKDRKRKKTKNLAELPDKMYSSATYLHA